MIKKFTVDKKSETLFIYIFIIFIKYYFVNLTRPIQY